VFSVSYTKIKEYIDYYYGWQENFKNLQKNMAGCGLGSYVVCDKEYMTFCLLLLSARKKQV